MTTSEQDLAVVERWWRHFVQTGRVPDGLPLVQGRLIRAVHRGDLPSGPVFVKAMTFPRAKDRLRYSLRALPARHEARLLAAVRAASVPCPEVLAVRTLRRAGLPTRSMLVLRALAVAAPGRPVAADVHDAAALARTLLAAGIEHRDLHLGNFVRLVDGRLAVLDLQSARLGRATPGRAVHVAAAARLLRGLGDADGALGAAVLAAGLVVDESELAAARAAAARGQQQWDRGRVRRCLDESTEFTHRWSWTGVLHRRRGDLPPGRWQPIGDDVLVVWLGQRALQVFEDRAPSFPAVFRNWWWLGGGGRLYVPAACEDRIEVELGVARQGYARYVSSLSPGEQ